jgi:hypothetical protein
MDGLLDQARTGPCYPSRPEIANLVVDAIRLREGSMGHFQLHHHAVMPPYLLPL